MMRIKALLFALFFISTVFSINPSIGSYKKEELNTLKKEVQIAINSLTKEKSIVFYNLHLSQDELKVLKSIKINSIEEYNNFGNLNTLRGEVMEFIKLIGNNNVKISEATSDIVLKIVRSIVQASGEKTAWISLRSFTPTSLYDKPRWHTDGYYYSPYSGDPYKFVITLKGPSTLFYIFPIARREEFFALQSKGNEHNEFNRQVISDMLGNSQKLIVPTHHGAVYIVGSDNAAIHSEPPIKEERLFLSILTGKKEQIEEWEASQSP